MKNLILPVILLLGLQVFGFEVKKEATKLNFNQMINDSKAEGAELKGSLDKMFKKAKTKKAKKRLIRGEIDSGGAKLVYSNSEAN